MKSNDSIVGALGVSRTLDDLKRLEIIFVFPVLPLCLSVGINCFIPSYIISLNFFHMSSTELSETFKKSSQIVLCKFLPVDAL